MRVAALLLVLCAGCASPGNETLLEDGVFGDVRSLCTPSDKDIVRTRTYPPGYISSDYAETPRPASAAQVGP